jgi:hypothetical protein
MATCDGQCWAAKISRARNRELDIENERLAGDLVALQKEYDRLRAATGLLGPGWNEGV